MRVSHHKPVEPGWPEQPKTLRSMPLLIAVAIALVLIAMLAVALLGSTISPGMFS
ncbi:MAG: hypothetical protein HYV09_33125 [Deltaproteobacteria bacterium]|nr:hypothetical protein [Deltaproteobacteria bacterium]